MENLDCDWILRQFQVPLVNETLATDIRSGGTFKIFLYGTGQETKSQQLLLALKKKKM